MKKVYKKPLTEAVQVKIERQLLSGSTPADITIDVDEWEDA